MGVYQETLLHESPNKLIRLCKSSHHHGLFTPTKGGVISTLFINPQAVFLLLRCMECRRDLAMGILYVRQSVCPSVRLSVRPSVKRVHCDKTEESYV